MNDTSRVALGSILVGLLVLGLKYLAYRMTGSVALYSDALESIINVATAAAAFFAVRLGALPADDNHPYGHHKAEYLSAVLEGVLIVVAALSILRSSYHGLLAPQPLDAPVEGLAINAAATVINAAWSVVLARCGQRWRSPALLADASHLRTDVITSVGVLGGVALAAATGWSRLDPLLAALVAVHILWAGWQVMRISVGGLMDEAVPTQTLARVHEIITSHADGAIETHDVRTRHAGRVMFVDFHLVVAGSMTVHASHAICDRIEAALRRELGEVVISIHVEPEEKAKHAAGARRRAAAARRA